MIPPTRSTTSDTAFRKMAMKEENGGRPVRSFGNGGQEPDPLLCRYLRTKSWYAPDSSVKRDLPRPTPTAQYWCLKTMRPDGPDGVMALPEDCTDERGCFEPAVAKGE